MPDRYRFILLFTIIIGLVVAVICLGLGTVKEETSYGLRDVLGILATLAGSLSVFPSRRESDSEQELISINKKQDRLEKDNSALE